MARQRGSLLLTVCMMAGLLGTLHAQVKIRKIPGIVPKVICYANNEPSDRHIPPPEAYRSRLKSGQEAGATIEMIVIDAPDPQANAGAQEAANIWASLIYSPVPIRVEVKFEELESGMLGSASPDGAYYVDDNGHLPRRVYYTALAEKLYGRNVNGNLPDMYVSMNATSNWYYGTDGNPTPKKFDFMSVLLHEMTHGLGFIGSFYVDGNGLGSRSSTPYVFDHFLENIKEEKLIDTLIFPLSSQVLGDQLQSSPVYFRSPLAWQELNEIPKLFVPDTWNSGSSLYHLDELVYNIKNSGRDAMMTPYTSQEEVLHDPGPIATMMLWEMGWLHTYIRHDSLLDRENLADPFTVTALMYGDTAITELSQYLFYSFDGQTFDSLAMASTGNPTEYSADIPVSSTGTAVNYYIRTEDVFGRVYTMPAQAPENSFRFYVGTDTISPVIEHRPIRFMLVSNDSVEVTARIWDNLGIEVTQVEYKINDADQAAFDLYLDTLTDYKGHFIFSPGQLNPGDVIQYRIKAVDGSLAQHTSYHPEDAYHSFNVEDIPPFQDEYENDFEIDADDFLISGSFSRQKPDGFSSYALHSEHPYPEPGKELVFWNFIAQLKIPIRLNPDNPFMTFDEVAFIEPGASGTVWPDEDFFDYVIVEGSKDGSVWKELTEGYDCRAYADWETAYGDQSSWVDGTSLAVATEGNIKTRLINLVADSPFQAEDVILIRFRLHTDPFANGWGWMIDNLEIQLPGTSIQEYPLVPETISVYPNPSTGLVKVDLQMKENVANLEIVLMDMLGREILREDYPYPGQKFSHNFWLNDHPNGVYMMQFRSGNQKITKKIILAR